MIMKIVRRKTGAMMENSTALVPDSLRRPLPIAWPPGSGVGALLDLVRIVLDHGLDDPGDDEREDDDDGGDDRPLHRRGAQLGAAFAASLCCAPPHQSDEGVCVE